MLRDSRARALVVSAPLLPSVRAAARQAAVPRARHRLRRRRPAGHLALDALLARGGADAFDAGADDLRRRVLLALLVGLDRRAEGHGARAFEPRSQTAELYARAVLGIREDDVVFSAAKLFFAYGLGNALTFPLRGRRDRGADGRAADAGGGVRAPARAPPTIFYGVPTLYAALLADRRPAAARASSRCAVCISAGEALPADIGERWTERFGVDILDGIGSTEMLHIFLSNRPGDVRYGTTGKPVPGYELRIVDEHGAAGRAGRGRRAARSAARPRAAGYWNKREKSRAHVPRARGRAPATTTRCDADGYYTYAGPHRRHAEGRRHLRVAVRGRGGARRAPGGARGGGGRRTRTTTS